VKLKLSQERVGEIYIFLEAVIWGFFPILALKSANSIPPLLPASLCMLLSLLLLFPLTLKKNDIKQVFRTNAFKYILASTFYVGVVFYSLVFIAGKYSHPITVSILLLLEVPATFIVLRRKEAISTLQKFGGVLVLISAFLVMFNDNALFEWSSLLIVVAVFFAPLGNYYNKQARSHISSTTFVFFRNVFTGLIIMVLSLLFEDLPTASQLKESMWFVVPNGIIVFGLSKILWVEGIHRITIGKAISLNAIFPLVTILASFAFLSKTPTVIQVFAFFPALIGVMILTKQVGPTKSQ